MNSLLTLVALAAVQALFLLLGLGITARVPALRRSGWAVALAPLVGHLALIVLGLGVAVRVASGGPAVLGAAGVLLAVTATAPRALCEAVTRFARSRAMRRLTALAMAVQLFNAAGLLAAGVATYNGNANLDAWFYAMDTELLEGRRYFEPKAPEPLRPLLHTIPTATRVGAQMSVLLVAEVLPLDVVQAFNLTLASLVPLVCVAAAYLAREGVRLPWRWALLAAGLGGIHSSLSVVYLNQHLGHVLSLAVTPTAVTAAARCGRSLAGAAFAGFLAAAALFAYWPTMLLVVVPIALVAAAEVWRGRIGGRMLAAFGLSAASIVLLSSPTVLGESIRAMVHAHRTAARNDPALLAFNPYLTEDVLPLAAGLVRSGAFTGWRLAKGPAPTPGPYLLIAAHHAIALALAALAVLGLAGEVRRRRWLLPALLGIDVVLLVAMVRGDYGYGAYKVVSWMHVALLTALVAGVRMVWRRKVAPWRGLPMAAALAVVLCGALNLGTLADRVRASVVAQPDTFLGGPLFARNSDWQALQGWAERTEEPVLIGLHPHVAQYWASYRLRRSGYALLVPQDTMGGVTLDEQAHHQGLEEVPDQSGPLGLDTRAASACRLFVDWATPIDVTRNRFAAPPVERNETFALYRMEDVTGFLSVRAGWHVVEALDPAARGTRTFRWMRSPASLLLFRFPVEPIRLVFGVQSGFGLPTLDRRITVRHRGRSVATFAVEGTARIATPPLVPESPFDEVVLEVDGEPRPTRRAFTLWNRWVLHDPRPITLAVSDAQALRAGEAAGPTGLPLRRWSPREVRAAFLYDGLHPDDWLGRRFTVTVPGSPRLVRVALDAFDPAAQEVRLSVDGGPPRAVRVGSSGSQVLEVDLTTPAGGDGHVIAVEFERWREESTSPQRELARRRVAARLLWLDLR